MSDIYAENHQLDPPPNACAHEWTDARNEKVESGEICLKCGHIRAGNYSQSDRGAE